MQAIYALKRFGVFVLILWLAATLNFFLPRLSGQDPVRTKLLQQAQLGVIGKDLRFSPRLGNGISDDDQRTVRHGGDSLSKGPPVKTGGLRGR